MAGKDEHWAGEEGRGRRPGVQLILCKRPSKPKGPTPPPPLCKSLTQSWGLGDILQRVFFCEKVQRRLYQTPSPIWFSTSNLPIQEAHHAWNNIEILVKSCSVECCEKLKRSLSYSKETKAGIFPKNSMSLGLEYCLWLGGSEDMVQTKRPRIALKCRKLLPQVQVHVESQNVGQDWKANRLLVSREADFKEKLQGVCCCVWFSIVPKNLGQAD